MNTYLKKNTIPVSFIYVLYLIFFTSLIFSFRAISSISLVIIILAGLIINGSALSVFLEKKPFTLFVAGCLMLFLLQILALLYTSDISQGWADIRIKSGLIVTPLAVLCCFAIPQNARKKLFFHYCLLLVTASLYCLVISFIKYQDTNDAYLFFYHPLVSPIKQHAIYFSLLVVIGLIFLMENFGESSFFLNRLFHVCLMLYLSIFLFLLSSKLVIAFYLFYLTYYFIKFFNKNKVNRWVVAILITMSIGFTSLIFILRNPIQERFSDILKGNISVVTQDKFSQGDYFNGLQFRLLQWRFVPEILTENNSWWIGVGPGDAQDLLNKKIIEKNMYTGDPARGNRGYLIYNTHNQFLQTLLQNGMIGLGALLIICISLVMLVMQKKTGLKSFVISLLLCWLFTESPFETQYGIIIFTFFPLFVNMDKTKSQPSK